METSHRRGYTVIKVRGGLVSVAHQTHRRPLPPVPHRSIERRFKENGSHHAHEADLAIECFLEVVFVFEAFHVQFGHTAPAARRLMRHPLGGQPSNQDG